MSAAMIVRRTMAIAAIGVASACGSATPEADDGAASSEASSTTAAASAFSDPADAELAAMTEVREDCIRESIAVEPSLGPLFEAADAAGGSVNLDPDRQVAVMTVLTECSPPQLVARRLAEVDQPWLAKPELDCLATVVKESPTQGLAYLGLLHLLSGRLEAPAWSGAAQDVSVVGATSCVSPTLPILGESVASLLEDPASAPAVDAACFDALFATPEQRVMYWLQRYRQVVHREPADEQMKLTLDGTVLQCLDTGILYQSSLRAERGIEISNETAQCITAAIDSAEYARLSALGDPAAETLLGDAAGACVTDAERQQFGD